MVTHEAGLRTPNAAWLKALEIAILVAAILISISVILKQSGVVPGAPMDQHFVETVNIQLLRSNGHWVFQYPNLQHAGGISSSLTAGLYKLIIPTTHENLNWHFRIFSMATLLISSFSLFQTAIPKNPGLRTAAFLIIATSGFQFLEPTSEVVTATFLNLFLIAVLRSWPTIVAGLFLALFGLGKVELTLAATALSLFWCYWKFRQREKNAWLCLVVTWLWMSALLLPGLVVQGANPFIASRSTTAFLSAYTGFMRPHQVQSLGKLTEGQITAQTLQRVFDGSTTFPEIVGKHPKLYADYLGVSAARSIPNLLGVFKFMTIPIIAVFANWKRIHSNRFLVTASLIAAICILAPSWMVIFVRMRYIAKVLPAITAATLAGSLELKNNNIHRLTIACVVSTIVYQLAGFSGYQD
jgi:hypothetical protein